MYFFEEWYRTRKVFSSAFRASKENYNVIANLIGTEDYDDCNISKAKKGKYNPKYFLNADEDFFNLCTTDHNNAFICLNS